MRYAKFITTINLLFFFVRANACVDPVYSPSGYYLFHLVDLPDNTKGNYNHNGYDNCLLWQQQTSTNIPWNDIYQLVYRFDIESLAALKTGTIPMEVRKNQMAQWLVVNNDQEAIDYLVLAKNCEWLRRESLSPWYYPSKKDPVRYSLNDVAEVAKQKTNGRFADRYALQAVRAMMSLQQYEDITRFWDEKENNIPQGVLRQMILSYVAGAYVHLDDYEKAIRYYIMADDICGLLSCDQRFHGNMSRVEEMEIIYKYYPDCPEFRLKLWQILGEIEPDSKWDEAWNWGGEQKKEELSQLALLCDKVLNGDSRADKALWAYAATYVAHIQGDDMKADRYLRIAENTKKDQNLSDAIGVMRVFIDAQICTYDKKYEQKLFAQLRWLQGMLETHIDDETIAGTNNFYGLKTCRSYYYWSDAMRCILLGTVCPKMIEAGNTPLALQLANMSSYSLLNEIGEVGITYWDTYYYGSHHVTLTMDQYRHSEFFNDYDYSSHFAIMMDTLTANDLMAYVCVAERPQTEFQRFLNAHSYVDLDFLNEMVGTHCLREMRYADAERYLTKVSADYNSRTNVFNYLNRDPFYLTPRRWSHGMDAKLCFAKTMNRLEHEIADATEPNQKALLMLDYGIGLRNSFDYCWALTQYRQGRVLDILDSHDWQTDEYTNNAMQRVREIFDEAIATFTNEEYAAQVQLRFCNYKTLMERYPKTRAGESIRGRCDNYWDYHAENKRFAYLGEWDREW